MTSDRLVKEILAGQHDSRLTGIMQAVTQRQISLRGVVAPSNFGVGDAVRFNSACGTKYLIGHTARVVGRRRTKVVVLLDKPVGRFIRMTAAGPTSAEIAVPLSIIDPA
jgi:hypothetical protein